VTLEYSEMELDALREVSNIGSGTAATALSSLLGRPVDVSVPAVYALPLADAVDAVGVAEEDVTAVLVHVTGEMETMVVLLFGLADAETLTTLLGVAGDPEMSMSALSEIGNILAASYLGAISMMTGLALEPEPPLAIQDMLGAVVASVLALGARDTDTALLLDSQLTVEDADTKFAFMFLLSPGADGVGELLARLGIG
jgi:chemotaxis protein CheC